MEVISQMVIELEAESQIWVGLHERSPACTNQRNGCRKWKWESMIGQVDLTIPKLRRGSLYPSLLEPRKRSEKALLTVVQEAARALGAEVYFAHPYASRERGTNENINSLIRQYFPMDARFYDLKHDEIAFVKHRLNTRPRKCLPFSAPMVFLNNHGFTWVLNPGFRIKRKNEKPLFYDKSNPQIHHTCSDNIEGKKLTWSTAKHETQGDTFVQAVRN